MEKHPHFAIRDNGVYLANEHRKNPVPFESFEAALSYVKKYRLRLAIFAPEFKDEGISIVRAD